MKVGIKLGKVKKFEIGWCISHRVVADNIIKTKNANICEKIIFLTIFVKKSFFFRSKKNLTAFFFRSYKKMKNYFTRSK